MSLTVACGWTALRALCVALLVQPLALRLRRSLPIDGGASRTLAWGALLIPFFCPELLIGFAYSNFALSLVHHPLWNEVLYSTIVLLRLVPVAIVALTFAPPPPVSAAAMHCRQLAISPGTSFMSRLADTAGFWIRGPMRSVLPSLAITWLLAFQEFEIASLMWISAWTVWLFDAQAGGLMLRESLRHALLPLGVELAVLIPLLVALFRRAPAQRHEVHSPPQTGGSGRSFLWCYLAVAVTITVLVPFALTGRGLWPGLVALARNRTQLIGTLREIATAGLFGMAGGILATLVAGALLGGRSAWKSVIGMVVSLPGLAGSLVVSLSLLALFQSPMLHSLYNTPVPLVLATFLLLLPRAFLLHILARIVQGDEPAYLAQVLSQSPSAPHRRQGRELLWQLRLRGPFWVTVIVCYWGYFDLTSAAILAPAGMVTAPVRLYNLMHYGRNATLSAMTLLAIASPVMALLFAAALRRPFLRLVLR